MVSQITQAQSGNKGRMVVTRNFKYFLFEAGTNREQLFDLVEDPGELHPVTYRSRYREQLIAHRNRLVEWAARIGDEDFNPIGRFPELAEWGSE